MTYSKSVLASADNGLMTIAEAQTICQTNNQEVFEYLNDTGSAGTVCQPSDDGSVLFVKAETLLIWLGY